MSAEFTSPSDRDRLSSARHDLRNPLSEIIGFAELILEEAGADAIEPRFRGVEKIRRSAHQILAEINHTLSPDALDLTTRSLAILHERVDELAGRILQESQQLSDQCDEAGRVTMAEDLLRISGSARRLREMMPAALDGLLNSAEVSPVSSGSTPDWPSSARGSSETPPSSAVILVVDDQESNRALLARRLRKEGHSVSLAENGRHALERLRGRRFDLVLLDILMPEMDGVEVLRQVKADPNLAHIPVLMLSALDDLASVARCIELGAVDYLPKPFPPTILFARVRASLENKRMSDQLRKYTGWLFGKSLFSDAVSGTSFLRLKGQVRTVLFADIRGFTAWSERRRPEEAVAMLNHCFETAEEILSGSSIIKSEYTGDEIMGVFPEVEEAVEIARKFRSELGRQLEKLGLGIGVGVHTGPVIEGLMGGAEVKAYRFVGDTVNTARRICSEAKAGQVLVSDAAFDHLESAIPAGEAFGITAKGKEQPVHVRAIEDGD